MTREERRDFFSASLNIARSIGVKYSLIKTLESANMKRGSLYEDTKKSLINALEMENNLYNRYGITFKDADIIMNSICGNFNFDPKLDIEEYIFKYSSDFVAYARVFFKMKNIVIYDTEHCYEENYDSLPEDVLDLFSERELKRRINLFNVFLWSLKYNYFLVLLSFLDSYLNSWEYNKLTEVIRHLKYSIPYLFPALEKTFIANDFQMPGSLYLNYTMIGDSLHISREIQDSLITAYIYNKFIDGIESLLRVNDSDYDNQKLYVFVMNTIIRSSGVLLKDREIEDSKDFIQSQIYDSKDVSDNSKAIREVFKNYDATKKDKSLHKYLSLFE